MNNSSKPQCSRCGAIRDDKDLNGVDVLAEPNQKYQHAYCRRIAECQSLEAGEQLNDLITEISKEETDMTIQPKPVKRDADGNWKHPDLPDWPESTPSTEMEYWLNIQNMHSRVLRIGKHVSKDVLDRWLAGESASSGDWPEDYANKGYIVLAVSQGPDDVIVWLTRPKKGISQGGNHDIHTAA